MGTRTWCFIFRQYWFVCAQFANLPWLEEDLVYNEKIISAFEGESQTYILFNLPSWRMKREQKYLFETG